MQKDLQVYRLSLHQILFSRVDNRCGRQPAELKEKEGAEVPKKAYRTPLCMRVAQIKI